MTDSFRISTSTSTADGTAAATRDAAGAVREELGDAACDLAFVFFTGEHSSRADVLLECIEDELAPRHVVGVNAEATIGGRREYEGATSVTVWGAALPGAELASYELEYSRTADGDSFLGLPPLARADGDAAPRTLLLFGDPFTFPADLFLERLADEDTALRVLGGLASGVSQPRESRLIIGGSARGSPRVREDGAVAVLISGGVRVQAVVSQGCKPVGRPLVVTRAEGQRIDEIGGSPAFEKLREQLEALSPADQALIRYGLQLGLAIDAAQESRERGDFIVRNLIGVHRDAGSVVVADRVRAGQTVQLHLRDADSASDDLHALLRRSQDAGRTPLGGLLFSCNGRGTRLFTEANHDARAVARELGEVPLAGFFAAGELGPVGGRNFLHGFTASLALFYAG